MNDPRLTLARPDLAADALEGVVAARRYRPSRRVSVSAPVAPLWRAADTTSERLDELIFGETFDALEDVGEFLWGQARRDGYVGFVRAADLAPARASPTHWVSALRASAFAEPSIKADATGPFSLNALVTVTAEEGGFARAEGGGWFRRAHLAPVGLGFERDWTAVAERFLGAPYLWGGRTSLGLDCSGLVQQALYACGRACPRDADQQARLGRSVGRGDLRRGDLVCWRGHIGLMLDETRLLHANAHDMAVAAEPVVDAMARIASGPKGEPTTFRRL
ncbi:MAG TPA: NlpC/P60 family protein [Caulobacteraceae bacterium]|nr:NlpC/P60 family protein [Caulobacteraceae bacterium]